MRPSNSGGPYSRPALLLTEISRSVLGATVRPVWSWLRAPTARPVPWPAPGRVSARSRCSSAPEAPRRCRPASAGIDRSCSHTMKTLGQIGRRNFGDRHRRHRGVAEAFGPSRFECPTRRGLVTVVEVLPGAFEVGERHRTVVVEMQIAQHLSGVRVELAVPRCRASPSLSGYVRPSRGSAAARYTMAWPTVGAASAASGIEPAAGMPHQHIAGLQHVQDRLTPVAQRGLLVQPGTVAGRSTATAPWVQRHQRSPMVRSQHHAAWKPPCAKTNLMLESPCRTGRFQAFFAPGCARSAGSGWRWEPT